jgi:hypothetical protein
MGPMMMMMRTTMMMPQTKDKPGDDSLSKEWGSAKKKCPILRFYRQLLSGVKAWGLQVSAGKNARVYTHGFASPHIP